MFTATIAAAASERLWSAPLAAADALDAPMVAVLGDPDFYGRFGFRPSTDFDIVGEEPAWEHLFQIRTLAAYDPSVQGAFIWSVTGTATARTPSASTAGRTRPST
ncbi:hypothetical protein AB0D66_26765 [Streptomyces sp. NPDC048270]|uniref:hypothetical protein n=1 Tax=Streptomyces sp. NPDC048270 TaxID=3154615 RepID=UPI0033EB46E0